MIIKNGVVFLQVNDKAIDIWNAEIFNLYWMKDDFSQQTLLKYLEEVKDAVEHDLVIVIEVGTINQ